MKNAKDTFNRFLTSGLFQLRSDCMLVERLPMVQAKSSSGIILPEHRQSLEGYKADAPQFVEVIALGEGMLDESGEVEAPPFDVGNIILVAGLSTVLWYSDFLGAPCKLESGRTFGIMEADPQNAFMTFKSREEYNSALNMVTEDK